MTEHRRDVRLRRTDNSAVAEHAWDSDHPPNWDEVRCIAQDKHWYTRRVKEAIQIRLHPNNINRDSGIDIPEEWLPTIRRHAPPAATASSDRNAYCHVLPATSVFPPVAPAATAPAPIDHGGTCHSFPAKSAIPPAATGGDWPAAPANGRATSALNDTAQKPRRRYITRSQRSAQSTLPDEG